MIRCISETQTQWGALFLFLPLAIQPRWALLWRASPTEQWPVQAQPLNSLWGTPGDPCFCSILLSALTQHLFLLLPQSQCCTGNQVPSPHPISAQVSSLPRDGPLGCCEGDPLWASLVSPSLQLGLRELELLPKAACWPQGDKGSGLLANGVRAGSGAGEQ